MQFAGLEKQIEQIKGICESKADSSMFVTLQDQHNQVQVQLSTFEKEQQKQWKSTADVLAKKADAKDVAENKDHLVTEYANKADVVWWLERQQEQVNAFKNELVHQADKFSSLSGMIASKAEDEVVQRHTEEVKDAHFRLARFQEQADINTQSIRSLESQIESLAGVIAKRESAQRQREEAQQQKRQESNNHIDNKNLAARYGAMPPLNRPPSPRASPGRLLSSSPADKSPFSGRPYDVMGSPYTTGPVRAKTVMA